MKYEKTALRLRKALSDANMTQQELADKSHIGKSSISHYINGTNEPGNKSAFAMAKILNVNPAWLMGLEVPQHTSTSDETIMECIEGLKQLPLEQRNNVLKYIEFLKHQENGE